MNDKTCDQCGKTQPDVETCLDPFALDVHDNEVEVNLCYDCYQERSEEI